GMDSRGLFFFTAAPSQTGSNFLVRVRAFDSGSPSLAATQSFNIQVLALPLNQPGPVDFGSNCFAAFPLATRQVTFTNVSTSPVELGSLGLEGAASNQFFLSGDTGEPVLLPGQSRSVRVGFNPSSAGVWNTALIFAGVHQQVGFVVSVPVAGMLLDNVASIGPRSLEFGSRDIEFGF